MGNRFHYPLVNSENKSTGKGKNLFTKNGFIGNRSHTPQKLQKNKCEESQGEKNIYVSNGDRTWIPKSSDTRVKNFGMAKSYSRDSKLGSLSQTSVLEYKSHRINYLMIVAYGNQIETL